MKRSRVVFSAASETLVSMARTFAYGSVIVLALLAVDRRVPVEQLAQHEELSGLHPGDSGNILVRVNRKRLCTTDVEIVLFDGDGSRFVIDQGTFTPKRLGEDEYRVYVKLPLDFTPGRSTGYIRLSYRCNIVQQLWPVVETVDEFSFTVKP